MATIIEKGNNITLHCDNCNLDVVYNINEDDIKINEDSVDTASLTVLPQNLYKKYLPEIKEKFSIYQSWGYKKSVTKNDTALTHDENIRIYRSKCPRCHNIITKKEVVSKKYYIRIYHPDEYPMADDEWIKLSEKEVNNAFKNS